MDAVLARLSLQSRITTLPPQVDFATIISRPYVIREYRARLGKLTVPEKDVASLAEQTTRRIVSGGISCLFAACPAECEECKLEITQGEDNSWRWSAYYALCAMRDNITDTTRDSLPKLLYPAPSVGTTGLCTPDEYLLYAFRRFFKGDPSRHRLDSDTTKANRLIHQDTPLFEYLLFTGTKAARPVYGNPHVKKLAIDVGAALSRLFEDYKHLGLDDTTDPLRQLFVRDGSGSANYLIQATTHDFPAVCTNFSLACTASATKSPFFLFVACDKPQPYESFMETVKGNKIIWMASGGPNTTTYDESNPPSAITAGQTLVWHCLLLFDWTKYKTMYENMKGKIVLHMPDDILMRLKVRHMNQVLGILKIPEGVFTMVNQVQSRSISFQWRKDWPPKETILTEIPEHHDTQPGGKPILSSEYWGDDDKRFFGADVPFATYSSPVGDDKSGLENSALVELCQCLGSGDFDDRLKQKGVADAYKRTKLANKYMNIGTMDSIASEIHKHVTSKTVLPGTIFYIPFETSSIDRLRTLLTKLYNLRATSFDQEK
jgi:hypothetical protein